MASESVVNISNEIQVVTLIKLTFHITNNENNYLGCTDLGGHKLIV